MANKPTKILLYDLAEDIRSILKDLLRLQEGFPSLYDRLTRVGLDMLDVDTKRVVEDLINGYNATGKLTIQRVKDLELLLQISLTDGKDGSEEFTYDPEYQNVTKHTVKDSLGTVTFTIDYHYADLPTGKLSYSEKKFKDGENNDVIVRKDYTYDENENISSITTKTTVGQVEPEQPAV
jgi:hypothetical protein